MIRLRLWFQEQPVAWFGYSAGAYFLQYDEAWLQASSRFELAPQFPLQVEAHCGLSVRVFFENLLPEGDSLEDILAALQLRGAEMLEITAAFGKDLPGAHSLLAPDQTPNGKQEFRQISIEDIHSYIQAQQSREKPLLLNSSVESTMSLAGAQPKMGLRYLPKAPPEQRYLQSIGATPSTHILKPDSLQPRYQPSAINEYACMKLAKALKLPVPDVWLVRAPEAACIIGRYDRHMENGRENGRVRCSHQIDGCQVLGHSPGWKYERTARLVSLPLLVKAFRNLRIPPQDMLQVQRWVMFNYLIGNSDAHGKNISLIVSPSNKLGHTQYKLAPFYDLLCVRVYGDEQLALRIGDAERFEDVDYSAWQDWCVDCEFGFPAVRKLLIKTAQSIMPAWKKILSELSLDTQLTQSEKDLLQLMTISFAQHVQSIEKKIGAK